MKVKSVCNRLKELRAIKGISQDKLANLVDCTRQTIISIEQNKYAPSIVLIAKIAKILDTSIDELIQVEFEYNNKKEESL